MPETTCAQDWLTDFATIFAHMWYRDFPLQHSLHEKAQRADWTTHIGIAVRTTADLMGWFTCFESGERTDALLRDSSKNVMAALEWEWNALHLANNEFEKLQERCKEFKSTIKFASLISYARENSPNAKADQDDYSRRSAKVLEDYTKRWSPEGPPLLLVLVHYENAGKAKDYQRRKFTKLTMRRIPGQPNILLRDQPAYPWNIVGSRWALETRSST
jgi:hypothetical protein